MIVSRNANADRPFGWVGSMPLYVTTLLVIVYCGAMVIEVILRAGGIADASYWLKFTPQAAFQHFNFWRLWTYPILNEPSIWFLMEMGMLLFFGREVERFIGGRNFLLLYFALIILPVIFVTFLQLFNITPVGGLSGSWNINFAIFVSFVILYPRTEIFFGIAAIWVAIALGGIRSLELLEGREWISLVIFWLECLAAILLIRVICLGVLSAVHQWTGSFYRIISLIKKGYKGIHSGSSEKLDERGNQSVDLILEKISRRGISSLTRAERDYLEKARTALLERERRL